MDQFTNAERAYDWRQGGLAKEVFEQAGAEPAWFVIGGGTGGTAAVFSRYARANEKATRLCMPDPEGSAFFCGWRDNDRTKTGAGSRIEGIGRPRIEPSFVFDTVDRMMRVPNSASLAAMLELYRTPDFPWPGGSSGTHLLAALKLIAAMLDKGERGLVATALCDSGDRYRGTYYNPKWYEKNGIDVGPWQATIRKFPKDGTWHEPPPSVRPAAPGQNWDNV